MAALVTRTVRTVVADALFALGILAAGETPSAEDADVSMRVLVDMLARWSAEPSMVYRPDLWGTTETDENFTTPWADYDDIVTPAGRDRTAVTLPPTISSLDSTVTLPGEYFAALRYGLALELAPTFQVTPTPMLVEMARASIAVVKRRNTVKPVVSLRRELPTCRDECGLLDIWTRS